MYACLIPCYVVSCAVMYIVLCCSGNDVGADSGMARYMYSEKLGSPQYQYSDFQSPTDHRQKPFSPSSTGSKSPFSFNSSSSASANFGSAKDTLNQRDTKVDANHVAQLQLDLKDLQQAYAVEVQRRQALSDQLNANANSSSQHEDGVVDRLQQELMINNRAMTVSSEQLVQQQQQVSSLTHLLKDLQDSYSLEVQRRKGLGDELSLSSLKNGEQQHQHVIVVEQNERLQSELTHLKHDYDIERQRRAALSAQVDKFNTASAGSTTSTGQQEREREREQEEAAVLSKDYSRLQSRLKEAQEDYNLEVQRRQAVSRQLMELETQRGQDGASAEDKSARLQSELLAKSRELEELERSSGKQVSTLTDMLRDLQSKYTSEVQRREDFSTQVVKSPTKGDVGGTQEQYETIERLQSELTHLKHDYDIERQRRAALSAQVDKFNTASAGSTTSTGQQEREREREQEEAAVLSKDYSRLQSRLKEAQEDYNLEVQRRQAVSRQLMELEAQRGHDGASAEDKSARLQGELLVLGVQMEKSEESNLREVSLLTDQLRQLQKDHSIEIEGLKNQSGQSPTKRDVQNAAHLMVMEENNRLRSELSDLQHSFNVEVQRRQSLSGQLVDVHNSDDGTIERLEQALLAQGERMTESEENNRRRVSVLTNQLKELQNDYNSEVLRGEALSRQLTESKRGQDDGADDDVIERRDAALLAKIAALEDSERNHQKQVSLLTEMLADLQSTLDAECQQHQVLQNQVKENTTLFDLQHQYEAKVQQCEDLGQQLLEECTKSAQRSEDAITTIQLLKENNKKLEKSSVVQKTTLAAAESRCLALEEQVTSTPSSLQVASAEMRVMQAKMIEFDRACQQKVSTEQRNAAMRVR